MGAADGPGRVFRVGLLGFGTVGSGTARILLHSEPPLRERTGVDIRLHAIADIDLERPRDVDVHAVRLTTDARAVAADPQIDIVVETIGGIEPARTFVLEALRHGKAVVTANKALLALHGRELFGAARQHGTSIGFEAAVCGGVPLIGAMREGMVANRIESIRGILNGTSNYILTRMAESGASYETALQEAQRQGFAEADPTMDVDGLDAAHKLALLASLGFHHLVDLDQIHVEGIRGLRDTDLRFATELGYVVKLLGIAKQHFRSGAAGDHEGVELRVHPALLARDHPLAGVREENNAVLVRGDATGDVLFYGKGAGMMPTASAIVADIVGAARGSALPNFEKLQLFGRHRLAVLPMGRTCCRWYVRFDVADEPGVLARIAQTLAEHRVSIASFLQKEPHSAAPLPDRVPIVIITHPTAEESFQAARRQVETFAFVAGPGSALRIED